MFQNETGSERTGALQPPRILIPQSVGNKSLRRRAPLSPAVRRAVKASSTRNRDRKKSSKRSFDSDFAQRNDASSVMKNTGNRMTTSRLYVSFCDWIVMAHLYSY